VYEQRILLEMTPIDRDKPNHTELFTFALG